MDVLVLIDRLATLVEGARRVPLSDQVRIEREEIFALLDEMRAAIPDEVKQARRLVRERQVLLGEAERETERLLAEARQQAARVCGQSEIVRMAERQADARLAEARREANLLVGAVEEWADAHLALLEANLDSFLGAISRGRDRLRERSLETAAASNPH
jgi:cell division septum initiation protein DivIVA